MGGLSIWARRETTKGWLTALGDRVWEFRLFHVILTLTISQPAVYCPVRFGASWEDPAVVRLHAN